MPSVLFVCLGNICRSPMAEGIARQRAADKGVSARFDSAGTIGHHAGERADPRTRAVLERHGIPYDGRSRKLTADDFEQFDLILAMDRSNLADMTAICPADHRHKLRLVLEPTGGGEVPDPYYGGPDGFDAGYRMLLAAIDRWLDGLRGA